MSADTIDFEASFFPAAPISESATFTAVAYFRKRHLLRRRLFLKAPPSPATPSSKAPPSPAPPFPSATFSGDASFESATFSGDAYFESATFSGAASFESATFSGDAYFEAPPSPAPRLILHRQHHVHRHRLVSGQTFTNDVFFNGASSGLTAKPISASPPSSESCSSMKPCSRGGGFQRCLGQTHLQHGGARFKGVPDFIQAHFEEAPRLDNVVVEGRLLKRERTSRKRAESYRAAKSAPLA